MDEIISSDNFEKFIDFINQNSDFDLYSKCGSKKNCVFCKCAYMGAMNCLQNAFANEIFCCHLKKGLSYYAAAGNQIMILRLLQNNDMSLNSATAGAVKYGNYKTFMWLLLNDNDQTLRELGNPSIILKAAKGGNIDIFTYLIQNYPNYINYRNKKKII